MITAVTIINKRMGMDMILRILEDIDCSEKLLKVCRRDNDLYPYPPPGFSEIVTRR